MLQLVHVTLEGREDEPAEEKSRWRRGCVHSFLLCPGWSQLKQLPLFMLLLLPLLLPLLLLLLLRAEGSLLAFLSAL